MDYFNNQEKQKINFHSKKTNKLWSVTCTQQITGNNLIITKTLEFSTKPSCVEWINNMLVHVFSDIGKYCPYVYTQWLWFVMYFLIAIKNIAIGG